LPRDELCAAMRTCLLEWARVAVAPLGQEPAKHHKLIIAELEAVGRGQTDRLMLLLPPGSAKSTYASVLFPVWWFTQHPQSAVLAAAHTANLATHFGRRARNLVAEYAGQLGYGLARDAHAAANWDTDRGGSYFGVSMHGPIIGRRADLVLIDDPVKSLRHANSFTSREQVWEWYRADLNPRLKPGGRIVLIMSRWHQDDLAGRLLAEQATGGDAWRCLRLPMLAEDNDPLGRVAGAPLWPDWENSAALSRRRGAIGERAWAALYQQSPQSLEALLFRVAHIEVITAVPVLAQATARGRSANRPQAVRAWDLAATAAIDGRDPDWTVGVKLLRDGSGRFVVEDVVRLRVGPHAVEEAIVRAAVEDGRGVTVALAQDPGQAGRAQVLYLARQLAGYHVSASPESGAKISRAMPVASQVDAGNVAIVSAPWNRAFLEELREFPHGAKDDQVDALARAFTHLVDAALPARQVTLPLLQR